MKKPGDVELDVTNIWDRTKRRSGRKVLLAVMMCILLAGSLVACVDQGGEMNDSQEGTDEAIGASEESDESETDQTDIDQSNSEEADIAKEDIYEVLETEDATYMSTRYGICRDTGAGREWIYKKVIGQEGFAGNYPQMQIYENRLYLKTDITYKDGYLDWQDCGIRWIDLETFETGILNLDFGSSLPSIDTFRVSDGFIYIKVYGVGPFSEKTFLLPVEGKVVYNGKAVEDMTEQERAEYGQATSQWLLDNPGTLVNISNRTATENFALLDMNMDGTVEEITLLIHMDENSPYYVTHEILINGESVIQDYAENIDNSIWAVSLDGKEILLAFYEAGPSDDPYTRIYRYEDDTLVEAGAFGTDIRSCEITEEGIISGVIRMDVVETSFVRLSWQMNAQHRMEVVPQEAYDFKEIAGREGVSLLEELTLYTKPDGSESFVVVPQEVKFMQTTIDGRWISLETADGQKGWFEVEDCTIVELGKKSWEVFEGLFFAG